MRKIKTMDQRFMKSCGENGSSGYEELGYGYVFEPPRKAIGVEEFIKRGGVIPPSFSHNYISLIIAHGSIEALKSLSKSPQINRVVEAQVKAVIKIRETKKYKL